MLATLASALLFAVSFDSRTLWPLAWIAPVPVLVLALRSRALVAAISAFAAYTLGGLGFARVYAGLIPVPAIAIATLAPAFVFAIGVLALRFAHARLRAGIAVYCLPALWVAYEHLACIGSPHGTLLSIAYSQIEFSPLIQVASLTGFTGISFVLMLVPTALALAIHQRNARQVRWRWIGGPIALVAIVLAWGMWRLHSAPGLPAVHVGMASNDSTLSQFGSTSRNDALSVVEQYAKDIAALASRGVDVVVLPEKLATVTTEYLTDAEGILAAAARTYHVTVVAGLDYRAQGVRRNMALVFSNTGEIVAEYDKIHMLPGFEDGYVSGHEPGRLGILGQPYGVAICKDMDFDSMARLHAAAGTRLMFVPAWDFVRDAHFHAQGARLRGVEGGFSVVRAARQGLLTATDDRGRVLAELSSTSATDALLDAYVPVGSGVTPFSRYGSWFAWVCVAGIAGLMAASGLTRRAGKK